MTSFQPYDPNQAPPDQNGNDLDPPPDGQYPGCVLIDAGAFTAKSGADFVKLQWRTQAGNEWTVLQGFKSEQQSAITWSIVAQLGINPVDIPSLDALNTALTNQIGSYYDLGVKTNGKYRNTFVNGPSVGSNPVVQEQIAANGVGQPAAVAGGQVADEDIPF